MVITWISVPSRIRSIRVIRVLKNNLRQSAPLICANLREIKTAKSYYAKTHTQARCWKSKAQVIFGSDAGLGNASN
jgi:hypothetical protein